MWGALSGIVLVAAIVLISLWDSGYLKFKGKFSVRGRKVFVTGIQPLIVIGEFQVHNARNWSGDGTAFVDFLLLPGDVVLMGRHSGDVLQRGGKPAYLTVDRSQLDLGIREGRLLDLATVAKVSEFLRIMGVKDTRRIDKQPPFRGFQEFQEAVYDLAESFGRMSLPQRRLIELFRDTPDLVDQSRPEPNPIEKGIGRLEEEKSRNTKPRSRYEILNEEDPL